MPTCTLSLCALFFSLSHHSLRGGSSDQGCPARAASYHGEVCGVVSSDPLLQLAQQGDTGRAQPVSERACARANLGGGQSLGSETCLRRPL